METQVVRAVDAFHTGMGNLLLLFHSFGIRLLQRPSREPFPLGHRRPDRLSLRYHRPLLSRLSGHSLLSHGLRSQAHRP
ncbi:hypothetical protein QQP08_010325 [Theobroma cacao]|nr:hypothetical protein QQP08_010325 [Theobroma cacao]